MNKQKIKWITDTACDIPPDMAEELGIEILPFPVLVDGKDYLDNAFTPEEFYRVLLQAKEIPVTSRIRTEEFLSRYRAAAEEWMTDIVHITISSTGSGTYESALMAKQQFVEKYPSLAARTHVHIFDSKSYSFGYGHALAEGAMRAAGGDPIEEILDYIREWIDSTEIFLACYSLDFARRSGRINSTAAFVGEMLGLRPVIHMVDGGNNVIDKVRGDKNVVPRVCERAAKALVPGGENYVMQGMLDTPAEELAAALTKQIGYPPRGIYHLGPAVSTNAGPRSVAAVVRGVKRR